MARLDDVLQNKLGFTVQGFETPEKTFRLVTLLKSSPNLIPPPAGAIADRRLAYLVDVLSDADRVPSVLYVRTLIEYRRRAESTWRVEDDSVIHRRAALDLQQHLR